MQQTHPKLDIRRFTHFLATGFGSGLSPIIPGTIGTVAAIPIWWFFLKDLPITYYLIVVALATLLGCYICGKVAKDMGVHDHGSIVWDEFIGIWITFIALPLFSWQWILIGFLLFRLLDMWKPWPIRWFDKKVPGGIGIMLDDIIAALIALPLLYLCATF